MLLFQSHQCVFWEALCLTPFCCHVQVKKCYSCFLHCLTTQDNSYTCYRHHHCLTAQVNSYTCCRHHYCGYLSKPTAGRFSFVTHIKILSVRPSSSARERSVDLLFLLPLPDPPPSSFFLPPLIFLLTDRSVSHRQRWYTSNPSGKASL